MSNYPDINDPQSIKQAILDMDVLGGQARTFPNPSRYIEKLSDYYSESAIARLFNSKESEGNER